MREFYLKYLSEPVLSWDDKIKPRVRHPQKWNVEDYSKTNKFLNIEKAILEGKNIWIWSDHHFFHENVIKFSNRPYKNVEEMNQKMVDAYNEVVKDGDICIWAGDITFKGTGIFNDEIYPNFNKSYNILVIGNHDFNKKKVRNLDFDEMRLILDFNFLNKIVAITHIPFETENNDFINVHGHIHNLESEFPHQINVSIEALDYKPQSLVELIKKHLK